MRVDSTCKDQRIRRLLLAVSLLIPATACRIANPETVDVAVVEPSTIGSMTTTTSTTSTTSTSTTTTTLPPEPVEITLAVSGDTLTHSPLWRQAQRNAAANGVSGYDFTPMFADIASLVGSTDLAICHLETPIAPVGEEFSTSPRYGVPEEIVDGLVAGGYNRCSTASNHAYDRGIAGIDRTVDVLESRGLGQSGMARTPDEIEPRLFNVKGVEFSHLSYTFSYNGFELPEGLEWKSALIDTARIIADATEARRLGADVVIVSMHWGAEKVSSVTQLQRSVANEITATGMIDLVIGHHAHVLQAIEQVNGTWVLFGLGTFLSNLHTPEYWPESARDAAVVTLKLSVAASGDVTVDRPVVHPTWMDHDSGWIIRLVSNELRQVDITNAQRSRLDASLNRTAAVLGDFFAVS